MKVTYRKRAVNAITSVMLFVELRNTSGSGSRWFDKLDAFMRLHAQTKHKAALCKHLSLRKRGYSYIIFNDWVIAILYKENSIEVCRFIWGGRLK